MDLAIHGRGVRKNNLCLSIFPPLYSLGLSTLSLPSFYLSVSPVFTTKGLAHDNKRPATQVSKESTLNIQLPDWVSPITSNSTRTRQQCFRPFLPFTVLLLSPFPTVRWSVTYPGNTAWRSTPTPLVETTHFHLEEDFMFGGPDATGWDGGQRLLRHWSTRHPTNQTIMPHWHHQRHFHSGNWIDKHLKTCLLGFAHIESSLMTGVLSFLEYDLFEGSDITLQTKIMSRPGVTTSWHRIQGWQLSSGHLQTTVVAVISNVPSDISYHCDQTSVTPWTSFTPCPLRSNGSFLDMMTWGRDKVNSLLQSWWMI